MFLGKLADVEQVCQNEYAVAHKLYERLDGVVELDTAGNETCALAEHFRHFTDGHGAFGVEMMQGCGFFHRVDVFAL